MMDWYSILKTLHILSGTILFGTGLGIAFFMFRSRYTEDAQEKYYAVRTAVLADYLFTLPAVCLQPLTGAWLIWRGGYGWSETWLIWTYLIYAIAGCCWLPVLWIQIQLKKMLAESLETGDALPRRYHRLFRIWVWLGWPAFVGLVIVFFLMVMRPT